MYQLSLSSESASPVTLSQAKKWLKVTNSADDAVISELIDSVTRMAEQYVGRSSRNQTWVATGTPALSVDLYRSLVNSVTGVTVDDVALVDGWELVKSRPWPCVTFDSLPDGDEVAITFTTEALAHHAATFGLGIRRAIAYAYRNRGDAYDGAEEFILHESGAVALLAPIRIRRI